MNNNNPRVSIGLPVYNGGKYIEEALDSILAQTYTDFELIISDNASTDQTQSICETFKNMDQRISFHRNDINLGAAPNYNKVLELAAGEYFKWAAYDDVIDPTYIEKCVSILDQKPEVILCYSRGFVIDEKGDIVVKHDPGPNLTSLKPHQRFREFMFTYYLNTQMSGLMRSDILRRTRGYGSYPGSDEVLIGELSLYGEFYELPDRLFNVRLHSEQSTFGVLAPGQEGKEFKNRDRISWFSTSNENKIYLPTWSYYLEAIKVIQNAPISGYQRGYCLALIARKMFFDLSHLRALGKDLFLATKKIIPSPN